MRSEEHRWQYFFGRSVRAARLARGWTQEELSEILISNGFKRCKRSLLSQIEVGAAFARAHEVYYFRKIFGQSFERAFWPPGLDD